MPLYKRLLYYFGGFFLGLIILFFFLGGKKASCDYGLDARTLKNIRTKKRIVSEEVLIKLKKLQLDTAAISSLLLKGDVDFGESDTKRDSCNIYVIKGYYYKKELKISVENCEKQATITSLKENN